MAWWIVLVSITLLAWSGRGEDGARDTQSFRVAFSSGMFIDVNENDARAAVKLWGQTVARERGIQTDPEARIFKDLSSMAQALRGSLVDAVGMLASDYDVLSREIGLSPVFVTYSGGRMFEEYLLLVHRDSGIGSVEGLRGRGVIFHDNPRASLAPVWLDLLLARKGLRASMEFFDRVDRASKIPNVVLPVFFRKIDACLVHRSGFEVMTELNPQVGKQLVIIASSEPLVPAVFCFRADYSPSFKEQLLAGLRDLHATPAGQQVLTVFRSERMEERPPSVMQSALDLLAAHRLAFPPPTGRKPESRSPGGKPQ
ncbi:MAG: phosphate/phosphite/phosphonate ABC transporter substrate-binding protein [Syntrophobacteraceae bacterium]|nr:phosphate/phosphite/phosphonate ABC transporter substrate-binding protein [Syntrophobacteraceae bacterium]